MSTVNQTYLKDESGNKISPITSLDSIYTSDGGGIVKYLINLIYPIGSIYISIKNTNPKTYLAGTTWVAFGSGKTIVGVDTNQTEFATIEKTGGEKTHKLVTDEMPSHYHRVLMKDTIDKAASIAVDYGNDESNWGAKIETVSGFHFGLARLEATGGSQAHNNLQPYITVYMWKRTA